MTLYIYINHFKRKYYSTIITVLLETIILIIIYTTQFNDTNNFNTILNNPFHYQLITIPKEDI